MEKVAGLTLETDKEAEQKVRALTDKFLQGIHQYKLVEYKEARLRVDFLDPFLRAFGWDLTNEQGLSEASREVVTEASLKIKGHIKAPDYAMKIGRKRVFYLEAKKPSVDIENSASPAYQVRRYGYTAKLSLCLLSDFEEWAVYDTRTKPDEQETSKHGRVFFCKVDELFAACRVKGFERNIDYLYHYFAKEPVFAGSHSEYSRSNKLKKGQLMVDQDFLGTIELWRDELARALANANTYQNDYMLTDDVQLLIDRILFLRICEDRGSESVGALLDIAGAEAVYAQLVQHFQRAGGKYNSEIFDRNEALEALELPNATLKKMITGLYKNNPYAFDAMPVEILGQVYEQFLGKTIRLTASGRAKVEEKPEVRKAGGVYYTPQYIVEYIVENTLGVWLKGRRMETVRAFRVVDPACGSGAFLLAAYEFLLGWYLKRYTAREAVERSLKQGRVYRLAKGQYRLSLDAKKDVLLWHIYGVDIDYQAVEVTKLSLMLKLLEDEDQEDPDALFVASDGKALPNFGKNIQCGNSLVGNDYVGQDLFDLKEQRKINAFDWERSFSEVFEQGGFDCVIGNPPYVRQELLGDEIKAYLQRNYAVFQGTADLYIYFFEKALRLVKAGGSMSFIVANKWMRARYGENLRRFLCENRLVEIIDFGDLPVFHGATTYPCIIKMERDKPKGVFQAANVDTLAFDSLGKHLSGNRFDCEVSSLENEAWRLTDKKTSDLLNKIKGVGIPLERYINKEIYRGILTGLNEAFVIDTETKNRLIAEDKSSEELIKPFLVGKDIKRYAPLENKGQYLIFTKRGLDINKYPAIKRYLEQYKSQLMPKPKGYKGDNWKGRKPGPYQWYEIQDSVNYYKEFEKTKIIYPNICHRPEFTFDTEHYYTNQKCFIIPGEDKYLLGILNSSVFFFLFRSLLPKLRGNFYEPGYVYLKTFPIPQPDLTNTEDKAGYDQLVQLVESRLQLEAQAQSAASKRDVQALAGMVASCEVRINALVYGLYGLNAGEIAEVEG
ncbi:TaqI-like C-terminal specificity domain-containing protein [Candidatus Haliotispira prima]|uniref:site-specific DNA-methyltransferase (adenine-specific) n=1 Tax=Candidatus Haliotispira prima TaxID=3034016 RepID=A0ABY8MGP3_9SPIO|nr:TaqI-like C-terminal specificity domain-containing protein [Candidatus Haliotispira prima]